MYGMYDPPRIVFYDPPSKILEKFMTDVVNSIAIAIVIEKLLNFSSIVTIDIAIEPQ